MDVNGSFFDSCVEGYPDLEGLFIPAKPDLTKPDLKLTRADLVLANLLIEYIGYETFQYVLDIDQPQYVSCLILVNNKDGGLVSDSPYLFHRISMCSIVFRLFIISFLK
ncbi:MAG: hypothetical protein LBS44_01385 [Deltaproteobacteria bacterium]|nr:hypothetical protein [Deltaproteobacteria bacterium]